ncbi:YadA-like family protein [Erwinia sp. S63]|uniref:YadA-like family protein n=1 Tax=Erwinia sp. S63 TaxID=2769341 RepID=UPI001909D3D9|nr:YadA-like family protein [Erwinia sp. S63]MBK0095006.1 YadA-like family protein [Erwinia sp. S63]
MREFTTKVKLKLYSGNLRIVIITGALLMTISSYSQNSRAFSTPVSIDNEKNIRDIDIKSEVIRKLGSRFNLFENIITKNDKKAMAGISSAMSMSAIPRVEGKAVSMGLGGGSYGGQSAVAFGTHFKIGECASATTSLSYDTQENLGVAAGVSIGW